MRVLGTDEMDDADVIADHVALPADRPLDRAFVRLNMISSADGGTTIAGVSGSLGNRNDHAVFAELREHADGVLVGLGTVVPEHYRAPSTELRIYVVAPTPDPSGDPDLFASGRATFVIPTDAPPVPTGIPELRAGTGENVDLTSVMEQLVGRVIVLEGGPRLAGEMLALGLVDEFFHTIAPVAIAGESARVAHGPPADPTPWNLVHGFCDDAGYLFLRYARA